MGKISLIIKREYVTRVRKPAFIVMTLLGPVLFAAITVLPVLIAQFSDEVKTIAVVDRSYVFFSALKEKETDNVKFVYLPRELFEQEKANLDKSQYYGILYIPIDDGGGYSQLMYSKKNGSKVNFYASKSIGIGLKSYLEDILKEEIRGQELEKQNIDRSIIDKTDHDVRINTPEISADGKETDNNSLLSSGLGVGMGTIIYIFIFVYGAMVMRGVIEEKTSRIVEVIVSSVKPFQLMMGKIIGVGMVGLTQFVAWIILGAAITTFAQSYIIKDKYEANQVAKQMADQTGKIDQGKQDDIDNQVEASKTFNQIMALPFGKIIFAFLFYFIGGYLLYGAFFAAIGGAVDSETDTQQFMLPVTIPIIFSLIMMQFVLNNPDGPVAFWLSMIPLTSPVIMMVRIPFNPPMWQVALSMAILLATFIVATWLAGRIYRTGILMYGKKASWKELGKWLFYKG